MRRPGSLPLVIALLAAVAAAWTLSPAGNGPGITCDEGYYVYLGKKYVTALRHDGLAFFRRANIERNMGFALDGPPHHPPLGYWLIGWTHWLGDPHPNDPEAQYLPVARLAGVLEFGVLVWLVGAWLARREGAVAGAAASGAVALTPRVFGHAHLAAIDLLAALSMTAALLALIDATDRGGGWRRFALAGLVWGLALLVKLHGALVAGPAMAWLAWRYGRRTWLPLGVWLAVGAATFFVGWPWLWLDPLRHAWHHFRSAAPRTPIHCFYLGQVWQDVDVPWHYPWVMFLVTVPLGSLVLGGLGLWSLRARRSATGVASYVLLAAGLAVVLAAFSLPGVPVYDGERLFLAAYPLWAILVGLGAKWLWQSRWLALWPRVPRVARSPVSAGSAVAHTSGQATSATRRGIILAAFMLIQGAGIVACHPFYLSHYNLFVGGLAGAERLGFETTYWGDTVQGKLLSLTPTDARANEVLYAPSLAPFQAPAVQSSSPVLIDGEQVVPLVGWDPRHPADASGCRLALVYRRRADLDAMAFIVDDPRAEVLAENACGGVWLARLYRLPEPADAMYRRWKEDGAR